MVITKFDEYIIAYGESWQTKKAGSWQTIIGLQDVNALKASTYLLATAHQHIEDEIFIDKPN